MSSKNWYNKKVNINATSFLHVEKLINKFILYIVRAYLGSYVASMIAENCNQSQKKKLQFYLVKQLSKLFFQVKFDVC